MSSDIKPERRGIFFGVPHRVRWIIYLSCFSAVANGYLTMVISAYLPEIGISSSDIGLLLGVNGAAMILTAIPFGMLADRIGRKRILVVSLSLIPLTLLIYALTRDVPFLLIGSVVAGAAEGAFLSAWNAMIADMTSPGTRTKAFSMSFIFNGGFTSLGFTLPFIIPFLIPLTGWSSYALHSAFFLVLAALAVISPVMLHRLLKDLKENVRQRAPGEKRLARIKGPYMRRMLKFSIFNSLIGLGAGLVDPPGADVALSEIRDPRLPDRAAAGSMQHLHRSGLIVQRKDRREVWAGQSDRFHPRDVNDLHAGHPFHARRGAGRDRIFHPGGADEHGRPDPRFLPHGHHHAAGEGTSQCHQFHHMEDPEQREHRHRGPDVRRWHVRVAVHHRRHSLHHRHLGVLHQFPERQAVGRTDHARNIVGADGTLVLRALSIRFTAGVSKA